MSEPIASRFRSTLVRDGTVVHKQYRRPDPRNDVERTAYRYLAVMQVAAPDLGRR